MNQEITASPLPFKTSDKIFHCVDEYGDTIGEPFSYDDWIQEIKNISGVSSELLGKNAD